MQVCGIAAPILDFQGSIAGSICIWVQREKSDMKQLRRFLPRLLDASDRMSAASVIEASRLRQSTKRYGTRSGISSHS